MKTDIYRNGPIQASFMVYEDLYGYRSGVYDCDPSGDNEGRVGTVFRAAGRR